VSNVLPQPTEFYKFLATNVSARKVSTMMPVSASHAHQDVLSAPTPPLATDVPFQPPTATTELAPAHKATSSLLNH
jgi:hypothetical protein